MARINNLTNFLTDISTAIKQKTGDDTPIPASEFDTKISEIETKGNYQEKEITLTENGNMNLLPDTGYDAMSKVHISVKVEGGSGEGGIDTSDATATAKDIINPATAYVNGEKITGSIIPEYDTLGDVDAKILGITVDIVNCAITDTKIDDNVCVGVCGSSSVVISKISNNTVQDTDKITISLSQLGITTTTALIRDAKFSEKLPSGDYVLWVASKEPSPHRANVTVYMSSLKYNPETHTIYSDYRQTLSFSSGDYCTGTPECEYISIYPFEFNGLQKCMWFLNTRDQLYGEGIVSSNTFTLSNPSLTMSRTTGQTFSIEATSHADNYRDGAITIQKIGNTVLLLVPYNQITGYAYPYMWSGITMLNSNGNIPTSSYLNMTKNRNMFLVSDKIVYINGSYYHISNINDALAKSKIELYGNDMAIYYDELIYVFRPTLSTLDIYSFSIDTYEETRIRSKNLDWLGSDTMFKKVGILPYITNNRLMFASKLYASAPYSGRNGGTMNDYYTNELALSYSAGGSQYLVSLSTDDGTLYNPINTTARSTDILAGKSAIGADGIISGSIPNNGELSFEPKITQQLIPTGYTDGGVINPVTAAIDTNIIPENIKKGVTILNVSGSFDGASGDVTVDGNLQAKYLLEGYSAVVNGKLIQGTMKTYGTKTITATSEDIEIPEGHYDSLSIPIINAANCKDYTECNQALTSI